MYRVDRVSRVRQRLCCRGTASANGGGEVTRTNPYEKPRWCHITGPAACGWCISDWGSLGTLQSSQQSFPAVAVTTTDHNV